MRSTTGLMAGVLAFGMLGSLAAKAQDMYPTSSFINLHANASSLALSQDYYDYYGYYNGSDSNSSNGGGGGAAVRVVLNGGFMFDGTYNSDKADVGDGNIRINQGTAGLGYLGHFYYSGATWYVELMYTTFQPKLESNYLCGGSCGTITYNGAGVKGGFMWPFAHRWYATLDVGAAGLQGPSGSDSLVQGLLGGSIGYKFTRNFGVDIALVSNAWVNNNNNSYQNNSNTTISVTSIQAGLSLHF